MYAKLRVLAYFNGTSFLKLRSKFACVDYSGITILITASILTTEFVTMYSCYWAMCTYMSISLALGVFGVFMNWSPRFDRPEARPLKLDSSFAGYYGCIVVFTFDIFD